MNVKWGVKPLLTHCKFLLTNVNQFWLVLQKRESTQCALSGNIALFLKSGHNFHQSWILAGFGEMAGFRPEPKSGAALGGYSLKSVVCTIWLMSYDRLRTYDTTYSLRVSQICGQSYAWSYVRPRICNPNIAIILGYKWNNKSICLPNVLPVYSEMVLECSYIALITPQVNSSASFFVYLDIWRKRGCKVLHMWAKHSGRRWSYKYDVKVRRRLTTNDSHTYNMRCE